jgi:hypothetical protein
MDLNFTNQPMDLNFSSQSMNSFSFVSTAPGPATYSSQPLTIEANNSATSSFTTFMDMLGPITKPQVRTKKTLLSKKNINY